MTSLFDAVRNKKPVSGPMLRPDMNSAEADLKDLVQRGSGVAASQEAVPQVGESALSKIAQRDTQKQLQDVSEAEQEASLANEQKQAALTQETGIQTKKLNEQKLNVRQQFNQKVASLLSNLEANRADLSLSKDRSRIEQAGFLLRLGNEQYVSKLQSEGAKARLNSDIGFKEALNKAAFANKKELLESDINFRSLLKADERTFEKKLANMSLKLAAELSNIKLDSMEDLGRFNLNAAQEYEMLRRKMEDSQFGARMQARSDERVQAEAIRVERERQALDRARRGLASEKDQYLIDRKNKKTIQGIERDTAAAGLQVQQDTTNARNIATGLGNVASAGIQAYDTYSDINSQKNVDLLLNNNYTTEQLSRMSKSEIARIAEDLLNLSNSTTTIPTYSGTRA